jgi:glucosamine kinase
VNYLGIDAGASGTKWSLVDQAGLVNSGTLQAMDGHLYRESSLSRMHEVLDQVKTSLKGFQLTNIYMGITGVNHDGKIEALLKEKFNCKSHVVSDIELAFRANFEVGKGILLYAGTGSIAYAIDSHEVKHQIGGWGYLLGEEGAGYWLGREAIRHSLFALESRNIPEEFSLTRSVLNELQVEDWDGIKAFVYSSERSQIAALSKIVDRLATKGDKHAIEIMHKAAGHLAYLVQRADKSLGNSQLPITFTGGVSQSKVILDELEKIFKKRLVVSEVNISLRAAELAR